MNEIELLSQYKFIFWDFDGVIMDSMSIRDKGFEKVLKEYPEAQVEELLAYHRRNGGLSRYNKFRYFIENILKRPVKDGEINDLASQFSSVMKSLLVNPDLLINEAMQWVKKEKPATRQFIVSGSDQTELRYLTEKLDIARYFNGVYGSPVPKKKLVELLLELEQADKNECCLIGDSVNDKEAAETNGIRFIPYNYHGTL